MTAAILSTGTELTRGELTNSNASWLAAELVALGFTLHEHATVDDDRNRIAGAMRRLGTSGARLVICTGGLGPTSDDLTAEAAALAMGVPLVRHPSALAAIVARYAAFRRPMPVSNEKQADLPYGAEVLENPHGTAPGFSVLIGSARFFCLPGVPSEMKPMFEKEVLPRIRSLAPSDTHQIHLQTFGLPEARVGEKLQGIEAADPRITLGYRAHFPNIEVKVLARGASQDEARDAAERASKEVIARLQPIDEGGVVYGARGDTLAGVLGAALKTNGWTLATAESCTGGLLGSLLTAVPGSSAWFRGGVVAYANDIKEKLLSVRASTLAEHGAVSEACAKEMAEGALAASGADLAIAITGVAGPDGGTEEKPVGTVCFGLAGKHTKSRAEKRHLPGDRDRIRTLAAWVAMTHVLRAARGATEF